MEYLTRYDNNKEAVNVAVKDILSEFTEQQDVVFKTITADNGVEFARGDDFDNDKTQIYFAPLIYPTKEAHTKGIIK